MKNSIKKILATVLSAALTVGAAVSLTSCGKGKDYTANNTTFKIGMSGPLTGGVAVYGQAVLKGAQLAVNEINAAGGLFGVQLELLTYDDEHTPDKVQAGFYDHLEQGMQVSLGCVTSAPCAEYTTVSEEEKVFFISPSASNDEIPKLFNAYQMCFADGNQGKAAAAYVNEAYAGKTIGMLYCAGDNYSEGIRNQFKENLAANITVKEASFTDVTGKDAIEFSSQINTLKDCEFIFMPIYYSPASQFMTQAKSVANSIKVYYGCDGLDGIDSMEGFDISTIPQEVSYLSHFNSAATEGAAADFVKKYQAAYNGETPIQFAAGAYDCVYAIVAAMKAAGEDKFSVTMSAAEVCDILTDAFDNGFTFTGATGTNMKWSRKTTGYGYVEKSATKYIVKAADAN